MKDGRRLMSLIIAQALLQLNAKVLWKFFKHDVDLKTSESFILSLFSDLHSWLQNEQHCKEKYRSKFWNEWHDKNA